MSMVTDHWFEGSSNSVIDDYIRQAKEDSKQIHKLLKLCYIFSEAIYDYISKFDFNSATSQELDNLKELKAVVDVNIADEKYKSYLKHRYIDKDYFLTENSIDEAMKAANADMLTAILDSEVLDREKDTDDDSFSNIRTE